jgi:hypothetical protein
MSLVADRALTIVISDAEFALLKKHDFPCSEKVLASARRTEEGLELSGSRNDFDSLAGWVAGEANYARKNRRPRQTDLLDSVADQLEEALARARR